MAKGFAIHNSMTTHGGIIQATQQRTSQMGNLFLRAEDGHYCPQCQCWSKIIKSHDHIIMDGKAVAYVDDLLTCGAKILPKQHHVVGDSQGENYRNFSLSSNNQANEQNNFLDTKYAIELIDIDKELFVPLGVPSFDGKLASNELSFLVKAKQCTFDTVSLEVKQDGLFIEVKRIQKLLTSGSSIKISWDGFINGLYNSNLFTKDTGLTFKVKGFNGGHLICSDEQNFKFQYLKKDWMDVVIGRKTHKIYINLRVNFVDSGAIGLDAWKYIPPNQILVGKPPYKSRAVSFARLKQLALEGIQYYWSRNSAHITGKNIVINGVNYELFLTAKESSEKSMPPMELIFSTNWRPARSANWELYRKTFYNVGYMLFNSNVRGSSWAYWDIAKADKEFKLTLAHEMGHELLLAYGGQKFSKGHKCTSGIIFQTPNTGTTYPRTGEIDLMKYAAENENQISLFHERSVASEEDVIGLLYISGIIKSA